MSRTTSILLVYGLPALILVGVALSAFGVTIPWYVLVIIFPIIVFGAVVLIGSLALAREKRPARRDTETGVDVAPGGRERIVP
jgi:hypothetical protein